MTDGSSTSSFIEAYPQFDSFVQEVFGRLIEGTKIANTFPADEDHAYFKTFKPFNSKVKELGNRLLGLTQRFIDLENPNSSLRLRDLAADPEDVSENFDGITTIVDSLVEKVDIFVDEARGKREASKIQVKTGSVTASNKQEYLVFYGNNIPRPQDKWRDEIDNSTDPFFPRISEKPNARTPLDPIFLQPPQIAKRMLMQQHEDNKLSEDLQEHLTGSLGIVLPPEAPPAYPHPYETELRQIEYTAEQIQSVKSEQMYLPFDKTEAQWVDTLDKLRDLARTLDAQREFAVDLEHHNYRSFQGLTCLMQVSTRKEDFIVDCLELRRHMHLLNSSFTNPNIVKILHGADWDILWLQKDFGLYVVNMFDTGQASRVLDMPNYSLAFLLKHYCGVTADKKYQLADWRIRPLPKEMLEYARADTHYLLYIYDRMRNELTKASGTSGNNLLLAVLNRSRDLCLRKYEKEETGPEAYLKLYNKYNVVYQPHQLRVFAALFNWRDKIARIEDESTRYVLPNHMLFHMAEVLPEDADGVLKCCNPVPPLVRMYCQELAKMIREAKNESGNPPGYLTAGQQYLQQRQQEMALSQQQQQAAQALSLPSGRLSQQAPQDTPIAIFSTEQLIKEAGWIDDLNEPVPVGPGGAASDPLLVHTLAVSFSEANRNLSASIPLKNSLFMDPTPNTRASTSSLLAADDSDDSEDDEDAREARLTAEAIRRSFSVDLFAPVKLPEPVDDTLGPLLPSKPAAPVQQPIGHPQQPQAQSQSQPADAMTDDVTALFNSIPQSMAEIYKLSNKNKKRKKKKTRDNTDSSAQASLKSPQSPFYLNDGDKDIDIRAAKRQKQEEVTDEDSVKLMREIGWIQPDEDTPPKLHQAPSARQKTSASSSSNRDEESDQAVPSSPYAPKQQQSFAPYDYAKHGSLSQQQRAQQQQAAQNQAYDPYGQHNVFGADSRGGRGRGRGRGGGHQRQRSGGPSSGGGGGGGRGGGRGGHQRQRSAEGHYPRNR